MMPSSNNKDEQENNELNAVQRQINERTNESLESTRRMLGLTAESQEVGGRTMEMLSEQGEKLNRIESGLDNINVEMNEAEKNLTNLQKCCGLFVLPWQRVRRRPFVNSSTSVSSEPSSTITKEPQLRMAPADGMPTSGYITRITNDDREEEMDDNLQLVHSYLGNLKNMAIDMGDEISKQNKQIKGIAGKVEVQSDRVDSASKRTQNLIRNA